MFSNEEKETLVSALQQWAQSADNVPTIGFLQDGEFLTPTQLVQAVSESSDAGNSFLEIMEYSVRREGIERVVQRLQGKEDMSSGTLFSD